MASVNKKQLIAIIAIVLVTNGITALVLMNDGNNSGKSSATKKITSGTLNPTDVIKQPAPYVNTIVSVKGNLVHSSTGDYFVVGPEKTAPGAVKLDFSKSKLDPSKYVNEVGSGKATTTAVPAPADNSKQPQATPSAKITIKGPFTVSGTLTQNATSHAIVLIVDSVK